MKTSFTKLLVLLFISVLVCTNALSSDVTFRATVKSTENEAIPRVYVKIYIPGNNIAIDSMFTDNEGFLERVLKFGGHVSVQDLRPGSDIIIKKLSPNIISREVTESYIEYDYPGIPELLFIDLFGRTYSNHSELSSGIYFYCIRFDDGNHSELNRMVVTENGMVDIKLVPVIRPGNSRFKSGTTIIEDPDQFIAAFIKDGYVTKQDTISIDASIITRNYQLTAADKPTANFTYSGDLLVGEPVVFNASASYGANGEDLTYTWDFGNGKKGQSSSIPHVYLATGDYLVALTVTGNFGASHSISKVITIGQDIVPSDFTGLIKGYISDENLVNVSGATVSLIEGDVSEVSDNSGIITLSDLPVGVPLHLKITKTGYVNQVVTINVPADTKEGLFFTTLNKRAATITLPNIEFGGTINGADGALLSLPFDGLLKPDGSVATGNISVSVTPVDVANNTSSFPGTFNAYRSEGEEGVLLSLGVSEYNFQQGGQPLQLAPGKIATVHIPIYTSGAKVGDKIPLWSINEDNGTWVEEGIGTVVVSQDSPTGLAMKAEIGHLSWWNCDKFDDPRDKDGICYRLECSSAICVREVVPCWWSGAFRDETKKASKSPGQNEKPPVFEVRDFVPASGKKLLFPSNSDVYIKAMAFGDEGELMTGNYTLRTDDEADTIKVELFSVDQPGDTVDLAIDSTMEKYLDTNKIMYFRVNIPETKLYRICLAQGSIPKLYSGIYYVKHATGVINNGEVDGSFNYFLANQGTLFVKVTMTPDGYAGNFKIGVYDLHAVPITENDSISDSLTVQKPLQFYSLQPENNTVLIVRCYQDNTTNDNYLTFISPVGKLLKRKGIYSPIYATEGIFTSIISKDSIYYFEISGDPDGVYTLITREDEQPEIIYGDTINSSLEFKEDIDLYHFTGAKDDMVSIICTKPNFDLLNGIFELLDVNGDRIVVKNIEYYSYTNKDIEIIYKLPSDGVYKILVSSNSDDDGSYQLVLNNVTYDALNYNALTVLDVTPQTDYYFTLAIPQGKCTNFTLLTNEGSSGTFNIWSVNSIKITDNISFQARVYYSYTDILAEGTYYLKILTSTATRLYINILEARNLDFNEKGYVQFRDTIEQLNSVNAYYISGSPGDGVHAILKQIDDTSYPNNITLTCFPQASKERYYLDAQEMGSHSLDSAILYEAAKSLSGTSKKIWAFIVSAESTGNYDLNFHHVPASDEIKVDNDFVEYPDAQTSSLIAAGYAVRNGGKILVANGEYSSYLAVTVKSDNIQFTGQDKENVRINNVYDYSYKYGLYFDCDGASISNLTISSGVNNSITALLGGNNITFENINIKPLEGRSTVYGRINGGGTNMIIRNVTAVNAKECLNIGSDNGIIENCNLSTDYTTITCSGKNLIVRKNNILVNKSYRAIWVESAGGVGNYLIDSNYIEINNNIGPDLGIIKIQENGISTSNNVSYVRNNIIITAGTAAGIYAIIGNPPSKIIIENNTYKCTYPAGGWGIYIANGRTDGTSSIIVRNNIFDGLASKEAIQITGVDEISENQFYGLYNNNFRMADDAVQDTNNYFMYIRGMEPTLPTDTTDVYIANNIFQANGFSYFVKCQANFSFYSDYNVVYNFRKYIGSNGTIIGSTHDIAADPLFTDDDLHIGVSSSAIDNGAPSDLFPFMPGVDRNGTTRPQGAGNDIGADETD
jgi:hypothetical protein